MDPDIHMEAQNNNKIFWNRKKSTKGDRKTSFTLCEKKTKTRVFKNMFYFSRATSVLTQLGCWVCQLQSYKTMKEWGVGCELGCLPTVFILKLHGVIWEQSSVYVWHPLRPITCLFFSTTQLLIYPRFITNTAIC